MIKLLSRKTKIEKKLNNRVTVFGKDLEVKVFYTNNKNPELTFNGNIINVSLPKKYKKVENINIVKIAIDKMYDEIARIEIEKIMEETRIMLHGLAPENYEIKRIANKYAKTLPNKTIIINPEIIKYDKQIIRYVILAQFCHLKYKTNCKSFFEMMKKYMGNSEEYIKILNVA